MRLLQINVDANNGSNGSIARDIGTMALERGWESYIAYGRRCIPSDSQLIRVGSDFDVILHGLESRYLDNHGLASRGTTKEFLKKVDEIKPDIIHLHNIHGYFINYRLLFQYIVEHDIPVVWTLHDCWPFTGHCGYPISSQCDRYVNGCHSCPARGHYPKSYLLDNSSKNFQIKKQIFNTPKRMRLVTVSKWLKSITLQSFLKDYPVDVIYDGIDMDSFVYTPSDLKVRLGLQDKTVLLGAAANWSEGKGWNDYIKLSSMLPKDSVIVLVGVSDKQRKELPSNIVAIPRQESKHDLAAYYSMADILLNLSRAETFGMTTAEAMSCGTPGISYNVTACPEVLSEDTGIIVEKDDLYGVLKAVKAISARGKENYRHACRERVEAMFNSRNVNKKYFDIYNSILGDYGTIQ